MVHPPRAAPGKLRCDPRGLKAIARDPMALKRYRSVRLWAHGLIAAGWGGTVRNSIRRPSSTTCPLRDRPTARNAEQGDQHAETQEPIPSQGSALATNRSGVLAQGDGLGQHAEPISQMPTEFAGRMIIVGGIDEMAQVGRLGTAWRGLPKTIHPEGRRISNGRTDAAASGVFEQHMFSCVLSDFVMCGTRAGSVSVA